jgi:hypothetical protein
MPDPMTGHIAHARLQQRKGSTLRLALLLMMIVPGQSMASEPYWVVGSFARMTGATVLQAELEAKLAENAWIVPHPDLPLHRVVMRVADVSEARLDATGIRAWRAELDFVPVPRQAAAQRPEPALQSPKEVPAPEPEPLLPGESLLDFCLRIPGDPFCQTVGFQAVQREIQSVEALRNKLLAQCAAEAEPAMKRICEQYKAHFPIRKKMGSESNLQM